jgi:hypothetical protein
MLPHSESLGFEFGAGLSIAWVRLLSPDGVVVGDDTFLCHTFFVGLLASISFFFELQKFLMLDSYANVIINLFLAVH